MAQTLNSRIAYRSEPLRLFEKDASRPLGWITGAVAASLVTLTMACLAPVAQIGGLSLKFGLAPAMGLFAFSLYATAYVTLTGFGLDHRQRIERKRASIAHYGLFFLAALAIEGFIADQPNAFQHQTALDWLHFDGYDRLHVMAFVATGLLARSTRS